MARQPKKGPSHVQGPFLDAQPRVVCWRNDLTRPGFFLGSCIRNSTLGHVVQRLPAYFFKFIKSLKLKSKNRDNGQINI